MSFQAPTPLEVSEYAKSIGFDLDGEQFCDHYAARGWRYNGNVKMVDWKAAVRTWKRHDFRRNGSCGSGSKSSPHSRKKAAEEELKNLSYATYPTPEQLAERARLKKIISDCNREILAG